MDSEIAPPQSHDPSPNMSASPASVPVVARKPHKPLSRRRRPWVSRDVSNFQQVEQVGEGTYGYVIIIL